MLMSVLFWFLAAVTMLMLFDADALLVFDADADFTRSEQRSHCSDGVHMDPSPRWQTRTVIA